MLCICLATLAALSASSNSSADGGMQPFTFIIVTCLSYDVEDWAFGKH